MIEMAKSKMEASDSERIKFEFGNAAKLVYEDGAFDLIITSDAPVYLMEAASVLSHGGNILVTYSFGGEAFINAESEIISLLNENGLHLVNLKNVGKGAVIHGQKQQSVSDISYRRIGVKYGLDT